MDRFWAKVDVRHPDECWPWTAATNEHGYGIFRGEARVNVRAHRMMWQLTSGETLTPDVKLLHSCDNPPCCNPGHLSKGTQADNVIDMHAKGRRTYVSRLSAEQVAELRRRYAAGERQTDLGREFGISQPRVSGLVNRKESA